MNASTWLQRGDQHRQNAAWGEALEAYQQALALDPDDADAHNDVGIVCYELKDFDQAEAHFQTALQLDPDLARAHLNLGLLYKDQGRTQAAQAELERYLELVHDDQEAQQARKLLKELSGLDYAKCSRCGRISSLGQLYSSGEKKRLCPRCYPASRNKRTWYSYALIALILLILNVLSCQNVRTTYYGLINLALLFAFSYFIIIPHELAHASLARLLKGQVFEIRVGMGQVVWRKPVRGTLVAVSRYPIAGFSIVGFPARQLIRLRLFLTVAAGPLFSALVLLLLVPGYESSRWYSTYAFREVIVNLNVVILFFNLFPCEINLGDVQVSSDGRQLWHIVTGKQSVDLVHLIYFVLTGAYAIRGGDYDRAAQASKAGLALYPDSTLLKNVQAVALIETGQPAKALKLFKELLASHQKGKTPQIGITDANRELIQAVLLNNVAYATVLSTPEPDAVQQAYDYARQAFRALPWYAPIQGTWGTVLIKVGRAQEGIAHLLEAYEYNENVQHKASNLAHVALGYRQLGDSNKAAEMLEKALALDPSYFVVQKVKAEMQG